MSMRPEVSATAAPTLFAGLIDDAAVFPPGNHPIDEALARRLARAATPAAQYVGNFLVPPALVERTLTEVHPVPVVVIGRPGADLDEVLHAAEAAAADNIHALAGVQIALGDGWERTLRLGVPIAVEVAPDDLDAALDSLVPQRVTVSAKLRTGATSTNPVPTADRLASLITGCRDRGLSFRLTGGLHHAVTHGDGNDRQFGFLNVLAAVDAALTGDGDPTAMLEERGVERVVHAVRTIDEPRAHAVRDAFGGYGCCDVDDPIRELAELGLIAQTSEEHP